jgi:hypothetical protein
MEDEEEEVTDEEIDEEIDEEEEEVVEKAFVEKLKRITGYKKVRLNQSRVIDLIDENDSPGFFARTCSNYGINNFSIEILNKTN